MAKVITLVLVLRHSIETRSTIVSKFTLLGISVSYPTITEMLFQSGLFVKIMTIN